MRNLQREGCLWIHGGTRSAVWKKTWWRHSPKLFPAWKRSMPHPLRFTREGDGTKSGSWRMLRYRLPSLCRRQRSRHRKRLKNRAEHEGKKPRLKRRGFLTSFPEIRFPRNHHRRPFRFPNQKIRSRNLLFFEGQFSPPSRNILPWKPLSFR